MSTKRTVGPWKSNGSVPWVRILEGDIHVVCIVQKWHDTEQWYAGAGTCEERRRLGLYDTVEDAKSRCDLWLSRSKRFEAAP